MTLKNGIMTSILFFTMVFTCKAQNEQRKQTSSEQSDKHEYSVYLTGSLSNLLYKLDSDGKKHSSPGFGTGAAYTFNFNPRWGISGGLEISSFGRKISFPRLSEKYNTYDSNSTPASNLEYSYSIINYEEKQKLVLLSIPVKAQFKIPVSTGLGFYAAGGFKVGIPVSSKVTMSGYNLNSYAHYEYENVTYSKLPQHGFFNNNTYGTHDSKIEIGVALILSLESGLRFDLGRIGLCTGIYFDYGLNNTGKSNDKHPVTFNVPVIYESVVNSTLSDKLKTMSVGLKAGIVF
jgi:hypothetical protein